MGFGLSSYLIGPTHLRVREFPVVSRVSEEIVTLKHLVEAHGRATRNHKKTGFGMWAEKRNRKVLQTLCGLPAVLSLVNDNI